MRSLRAFLRLLPLTIHLIVGCLLALLIAPFQRADRPHPTPGFVQWWHRCACRLIHLNIRVSGKLPEEPEFIVCNHISWLDVPVLGSLGPISFVAKSEIRKWPFIGWLSERSGVLFIHRGAGQTEQLKQQMLKKLNLGNHVLLFPEGTTSDGRDVLPFFPRLFAVTQETGRPIQPVALRYTQAGEISNAAPYIDDDVLVANIWRVLKQDGIDVDVTITRQLNHLDGDRKALANAARDAIVAALESKLVKKSLSEELDS